MERTHSVLLVEDNEAHIELIRRAFDKSNDGLRLLIAENLETAKEIILNTKPSIILTDWVLPDGNGTELIEGNFNSHDIPLVLMTSYGTQEKAVEAMKKGALDYIVKSPEIFADMPHIVSRALREWNLLEKKKFADQELIESEEKYRSLTEQLPVGIYRTDFDGNFIHANPALAKILKVKSIDELFQRKAFEFYFDPQQRNELLQKSRYHSNITATECKLKTANGDSIWVRDSATIFFDDSSKEYYIDGVIEDITASKLADEALRKNEARLKKAQEVAKLGNWEYDLDNNELWVSDECFVILGLDHQLDTISTDTLIQLLAPEHLDLLNDLSERILNGTVRTFDIQITLKGLGDNEYKIINARGEINFDIDRSTNILIGTIQDITKNKEAEDALFKSELRYKRIFENIMDVYYEVEIDGRIIDVSPSIEKICGYKRPEILGHFIQEFYANPDDREIMLRALLTFNKIDDYEVHLKDLNGRLISCSITSVITKDKKTNEMRIIGSMRDISERKRSEQIQHCLYEIANAANISENIDDLVMQIHKILSNIIDTTNLFISLYNKFEEKLYFPYIVDEFYSENDIGYLESCTWYLINNAEPLLLKEDNLEHLVRQGNVTSSKVMPKEWLGVPLKNPSETIGAIGVVSYNDNQTYNFEDLKILKFVSDQIALAVERKLKDEAFHKLNQELEQIVLDRTSQLEEAFEELKFENFERKRTAEELTLAKKELEEALKREKELNELKTRFISMVSHEYRTPLTVIQSSSDLIKTLLSKNDFVKIPNYLNRIQNSIQSMIQLLEDVLNIERTSNNKMHLHIVELDLCEFFFRSSDEFEVLDNKKHQIKISSNTEKCKIKTDEKVLRHIVFNLVTNAIKYSPEDTEILIDIDDYEDRVVIKVEDQGIGIPEEDLKYLFEPFHRGKNTGTKQGTGLGLSIVKRYIEVLGGSIEVQSNLNKGTKFIVELPKLINPSN